MTHYEIDLSQDKLLWNSIAPDIIPFYKFIPHYKEESVDYIAKEIVDLIFLSQKSNLSSQDNFLNKYFSKKLGVVTHYLADYACYPHAKRIRCSSRKNGQIHLSYEKNLNSYLESHEFKQVRLESMDLETQRYSKMVQQVKEYILEAVKAYERQPEDYGTDLDFALALNQRVLDGILTCEDPVYEAIFQQKKSSIISL